MSVELLIRKVPPRKPLVGEEAKNLTVDELLASLQTGIDKGFLKGNEPVWLVDDKGSTLGIVMEAEVRRYPLGRHPMQHYGDVHLQVEEVL